MFIDDSLNNSHTLNVEELLENSEFSKCLSVDLNKNFEKIPNMDDVFSILKNIRTKNIDRVIIATLNVERLRQNKFDQLCLLVVGTIDILVLTETKLDDTFSMNQFSPVGYMIFRKDRTQNGGGIRIDVREDIPCTSLHRIHFLMT